MSEPSSGNAGSLAADGKWQPQRWETTFIHETHENLQDVIDEVSRQANAYGDEGWEVVNSAVQRTQVVHHFKEYDQLGDRLFEWAVVCTLKRPRPPA
jgi:hypothetical protein